MNGLLEGRRAKEEQVPTSEHHQLLINGLALMLSCVWKAQRLFSQIKTLVDSMPRLLLRGTILSAFASFLLGIMLTAHFVAPDQIDQQRVEKLSMEYEANWSLRTKTLEAKHQLAIK
jgi:hypothetical protein